MGYLLTQDTSQQKVFCLVGPPRSGKGTINRAIQMLVGEGNYTSPTANDLGRGDFGLQRLIGRQLATISDMRMGRNADPAALAENLLRISGEDEVSINRKYKEAWEGRLPTRFLLSSNETPQFRDTSGAIVSRMVLMRTVRSFLGTEDTELGAALRPELPGVLNWSLAGLRRLRQRGHFLQPSASRAELDAMMTLASPVKAFAAERLRADPYAVTEKDVVWLAFQKWIDEEGLPYGGDKGHFFKDLGTCGLAFTPTRVRDEGDRVQAVKGLALLPRQ
jgi:P4 family phage/plasmid primase-like protien